MLCVIFICLSFSIISAAQVDDTIKQAKVVYAEAAKLAKQSPVKSGQTSLPKFVKARRFFQEGGDEKRKLEMSNNLPTLNKFDKLLSD